MDDPQRQGVISTVTNEVSAVEKSHLQLQSARTLYETGTKQKISRQKHCIGRSFLVQTISLCIMHCAFFIENLNCFIQILFASI